MTSSIQNISPVSSLAGGIDARSGWGDGRNQSELRRAARHSRLVGILKVGLPLIAGLIVAGGVGVTWLARSLPADVSLSGATIEDRKVVMQDPRMSGIDSQNRPYDLSATQAKQSLDDGSIELDGVKANLSIDGESQADVVAATGYYDPKNETLRLSDDVSVKTSSGVALNLSTARIDIRNGSLKGSGPVTIETGRQSIRSGSLELGPGGKTISFGGGVKMILHPQDNRGEAETADRQGLRASNP